MDTSAALGGASANYRFQYAITSPPRNATILRQDAGVALAKWRLSPEKTRQSGVGVLVLDLGHRGLGGGGRDGGARGRSWLSRFAGNGLSRVEQLGRLLGRPSSPPMAWIQAIGGGLDS